jgi:ERCC4-type nuclease
MRAVDDREPLSISDRLLTLGWERKRLVCGDFAIGAFGGLQVTIERKTADDLIASLGKRPGEDESRMLREMKALANVGGIRILMVEGRLYEVNGYLATDRGVSNWPALSWRNLLRSIQDRGIGYERTADEGETIRRLQELYAYYQHEVHVSVDFGGGPKGTLSDKLALLTRIPLTDIKTAQALWARFGSLYGIATASMEELLSVDGVGPKRAEHIYQFFR